MPPSVELDRDARMWFGIIAAWVVVAATTTPVRAEQTSPFTYQSTKTVAALQKCLTDKLIKVGEVVALKLDKDTTALVLRDIPEGAMTIELSPRTVTVTSKPAPRTRNLIVACL